MARSAKYHSQLIRGATGPFTKVEGHGSRVPYTHPAQQPAKLANEFRLDRAASISKDVNQHGTKSVEGAGTRVNSAVAASAAKAGFRFQRDQAVGHSRNVAEGKTTVVHPSSLTHQEAHAAASEHVKKIENIKGQREASQARTAAVDKQLHELRSSAANGGGGGDQPRDDHGRWTKE